MSKLSVGGYSPLRICPMQERKLEKPKPIDPATVNAFVGMCRGFRTRAAIQKDTVSFQACQDAISEALKGRLPLAKSMFKDILSERRNRRLQEVDPLAG